MISARWAHPFFYHGKHEKHGILKRRRFIGGVSLREKFEKILMKIYNKLILRILYNFLNQFSKNFRPTGRTIKTLAPT